MKKLTLLLLCALISTTGLFAITKTVGITGADYATLKAAFDDINSGTLATPIVLQIIDNTTETAAASITKDGVTVLIYPTVTAKVITMAAAGATIEIKGADNVTIDGRLRDNLGTITGSTPDLTIENSFTTAAATTNAIAIVKGATTLATNNTITYCNIKGSNTNVVYFNNNTGANTTATNNVISYNKFTPSTVRPTTVISINKGEHTALITRNNFENVVKTTGINAVNEMVNSEISYNSFYETIAFTPVVVSYIKLSGNSGSATNVMKNNLIANNFIGGSGPECSGTMTTNAMNVAFVGIDVSQSSKDNTFKNNTIKNISWTVTSGTPNFVGIKLNPQSAQFKNTVDGNYIGEITYLNNALNGSGTVVGIDKSNGTTTTDTYSGPTIIANNIINLGGDNVNTLRGIRETGTADANTSIFYNTVYISGSPASGSSISYCLTSLVTTNTRDFRNNIFVNTRSNTGTATGKHYGSYITAAGGTITSDYNNYYVTGATGYAGYYGADIAKTEKVVVTAQDANSTVASPGITPGTTPESFKGSVNLVGTPVSVTSDFWGNPRKTPVTIGAYEIATSPDAPDAPIIGAASAGNATASVEFTAPVSNGGSAITLYTVTSNPEGITATGTESPISVTGLTNGVAYTFTVTAANVIGSSIASSTSNTVTPSIGTGISSNQMLQNAIQVVNNGIVVSKNVPVEVISISGKSVWKGMSTNQTIQLAKGAYIVKATFGQNVEITKVIVR